MASDRIQPQQFTVRYISGSNYIALFFITPSVFNITVENQTPKQKTM